MIHTWNARDQTEKELKRLVEQTYNKIKNGYAILQKVSEEEDAHKIIRQIWSYKSLATEIEIELMRRSWNNGTSNENQ